jgi:hypothetical protein
LQDFDGEAERAPNQGGIEDGLGARMRKGKIDAENSAQWDEASDVLENIEEVMTRWVKFLERRSEYGFVGDVETCRNFERGTRGNGAVDFVARALAESVRDGRAGVRGIARIMIERIGRSPVSVVA